MKAKQLLIVLVLLAVLGGVALFLNRRNATSWKNTATSSSDRILNFPLNDVSRVTMKSGGVELNLGKKNEIWTVEERADYPADFEKISALLRKLWEMRAVQDVKVGPSQLARLELTEPNEQLAGGTSLDLQGDGKKRLAGLLLGKKHLRETDQPVGAGGGMPAGRYVMRREGAHRVFLISETLDEVEPKPERWLARDFIKIENPRTITLAGTTPSMNWSVVRDAATTPWKFADGKPGEELDAAKTSGLASLFASAAFADVLNPDAPVAETGLDNAATARFETFDNFVYELKIGKLSGENYPVLLSIKAELPKERVPVADEKPEDKGKLDLEFQTRQKQLTEKLAKEQKFQDRPYLIARSTVDQLLKDRSALILEKTPTPSAAPATPPEGAQQSTTPKQSNTPPRAGVSPAGTTSPSPVRRSK